MCVLRARYHLCAVCSFPAKLECSPCSAGCAWGRLSPATPSPRPEWPSNRSCITQYPVEAVPPGGAYHGMLRARRFKRCWTAAELHDQVDSIQVLDHYEIFAPTEPRHELVLLSASKGECTSVAHAARLPAGFQCGRYPHLWACTGEEPTFAAEAACAASRMKRPGSTVSLRVARVIGEPTERCQRVHSVLHQAPSAR